MRARDHLARRRLDQFRCVGEGWGERFPIRHIGRDHRPDADLAGRRKSLVGVQAHVHDGGGARQQSFRVGRERTHPGLLRR
jgi:hypothetical protein